MGFVTCVAMGYILNILSFVIMVVSVGRNSTIRFAIFYTVGNLLSMFGTYFLVGFQKQLKNMKAPARMITSIVFVTSMIATLVVVFTVKNEH